MGLGKECWIGSEENALTVSEYRTDLFELLHLCWPRFWLFMDLVNGGRVIIPKALLTFHSL